MAKTISNQPLPDDTGPSLDGRRADADHDMRMMRFPLLVFSVAVLFCAGRLSRAQSAFDPARDLHVYVCTFGPGPEVWEKFGHVAIRIVDDYRTDQWHDVAFNWGQFDFETKGFYWNYLQGRLMYEIGADEGAPTVDFYEGWKWVGGGATGPPAKVYNKSEDRLVREQELNLTGEQKFDLIRTLDRSYSNPKLRTYRYDYYANNCSTRVRDVLDDLIDHRLAGATRGVTSGTTYRWHTDRLIADTPWFYTALKAALGHPVDRPIDRWEEMFLPGKLHDRLAEQRVTLDGKDLPLVKSEQIHAGARPPEPSAPPIMAPWYLLVGLALGGVYIAAGRLLAGRWWVRLAFVVLTLPWLLLMVIGSAFIAWAWLFTDHDASRPNENAMQLTLLALPLLVLLPAAALGWKWARKASRWLTLAVAAAGALGLALKVLPWFYQSNAPIIALCLPVNAALALVAWRMAASPAKPALPLGKTAPTLAGNMDLPEVVPPICSSDA